MSLDLQSSIYDRSRPPPETSVQQYYSNRHMILKLYKYLKPSLHKVAASDKER